MAVALLLIIEVVVTVVKALRELVLVSEVVAFSLHYQLINWSQESEQYYNIQLTVSMIL